MGVRTFSGSGRTYLLIAAAAMLCALATVTGASSPAWADTPVVLATGTVTPLADPGATLAVPADGRLRGDGFAGEVLGVATGRRLNESGKLYAAAAGDRLWVFGLRWTTQTDGSGIPEPITATLIADTSRTVIPALADNPNAQSPAQPLSTWDSGATYWVVSVPVTAGDVAIEMSLHGSASTFSLSAMARQGSQPAVLYRDPTNWEVNQSVQESKDIPTPDPDGYSPDAELPVTLSSVSLSWFGPDSVTDNPSDPSQAWLVPDLSSYTGPGGSNGPDFCYPSLPARDITLTLPNGTVVAATEFPGLGPDQQGVERSPQSMRSKSRPT